MSKVGVLDSFRSTDVSRCGFDTAASTPWSVDLPAMFGVVSGWLRGLGTSVVSRFALLHLADTHALNLELFRFNLGPIASMAGSNDLQATFQVIWRWLCGARESMVSRFIFSPW